MKKTSLTRALFVAGVMAVAGGVAQADAIFYPDGTHVNLGDNAVENGLAASVLARSSTTAPSQAQLTAMGVTADQNTVLALNDTDTTSLGAGPARMTTETITTTTAPVYVFPNINFGEGMVMRPHRVVSHARLVTPATVAVATVPAAPVIVDTTSLGAGPAYFTGDPLYPGPVTNNLNPNGLHNCGVGSNTPCGYLPG
jgi:hypothetical protein